MKICFIVGAFPNMKCGVGDYTNNIALGLLDEGNEVSIITSSKAKRNGKLKIYNIISNWNIRNYNKIINKLKEIGPDVVHIQYPSDEYKKNIMINFLPYFIKKKLKCKVICTIHEYSVASKLGKIRNLISVKLVDKTIVVEKRYIDEIKRDLKMFNKKVNLKYIPICSNIPKSNITEKEKLELKTQLDLNDSKIISYFGFINRLKGFEDILEVLRIFKKNNNNIKLLFIGTFNNKDEYHEEIKRKIKEYNLEEDIIITGFKENPYDVANYLKISDVCMLPFTNGVSERNGSFLAAYIQNIPILTTSLEKEKNIDNIYYIKPNDINKAHDILCEILYNNEKVLIDRKEINNIKSITNKHVEIYN